MSVRKEFLRRDTFDVAIYELSPSGQVPGKGVLKADDVCFIQHKPSTSTTNNLIFRQSIDFNHQL
jgi:hypothetical protein